MVLILDVGHPSHSVMYESTTMSNHTSAEFIEQPVLLSAAQVADLMQISTRTVWRLLSAGELIEPVRMRGNTRWRRAELESWIAAGCPPTNQDE